MPIIETLKSRKVIILVSLLCLSILLNFYFYHHYSSKYKSNFEYISPDIAWMETADFLSIQNQYSVNFQTLKEELLDFANDSNLNGFYGIYFEDLKTGAWIGINEKEEFISASLLKVPVLVAILKRVEKGELDLNQVVTLREEDLNYGSGTLAQMGVGYKITIRDLLIYLVKESDNTALRVLQTNFLTAEDVLEARLAMGLPIDGDHISLLGPKQYSNILRSLYYSAYLRRTFSELALSMMSETDYNSQIPAGVPKNVPVAHKVGYLYSDGVNHYHDCGIVYHPVKPYILCIMSVGADEFEADRVMSKISNIVYKNVDEVSDN